MTKELKFEKIDAMEAVNAVNATLRRIDERLIDHGERVAFLACEIALTARSPLDLKTLFLLSIFHDIGAYKTDEIDRMVEFETQDVMNHSVYGYLFLKYLTPLHDYAEALLYHHAHWTQIKDMTGDIKEYAALLFLADRIDIALTLDPGGIQLEKILSNRNGFYSEEYVTAAKKCFAEKNPAGSIADGSYRQINLDRCGGFLPSNEETLQYLQMVVYAIDFRSDHTVTHTINTVSLALDMARHCGIDLSGRKKSIWVPCFTMSGK